MGCGCGLLNPYEECAYLLKDFNKLVLQRKEFINNKKIKEKKQTDKKALYYRVKIYKNLEEINSKPMTRLETQKLKQLNDLFLVLLTEESNMKKKENNNIDDNDINSKEILIVNSNKINGKNKKFIEIKDKTHINLISE